MSNGYVGIKQDNSPDRYIDNEIYTVDGNQVFRQKVTVGNVLVPTAYDEITLGYTGSNVTTVVYKLAGVTVATLTLGYAGSNLTSVVRT